MKIDSFSRRMWRAVEVIESAPRELHRQLDEAFENYDGHAMAAALWNLSNVRPRLAEMLPKYVAAAHTFPETVALLGKPMSVVRAAAERMRAEGKANAERHFKTGHEAKARA